MLQSRATLESAVFKQRVAREEGPSGRELKNRWLKMAVRKSTKAETGVLASVYETVSGLHKAGLVDKAMMLEFEALSLATVEPLNPEKAKGLRAIARPPG